jgi:hypothetical protein
MDAPLEKAPFAWQFITGQGVGRFARATWGRLLVTQFGCALAAAVVVVWFLVTAWCPAVTEAIRHLPPAGEIRSGKLDWRGDSPQQLAEGHFLAIAVDLKHEGRVRSPAHVEIEFGEVDLKIFSLLGFVQHEYPRWWILAFNRAELEPAWGAWQPPVLGIAAIGVIAGLMSSWIILATIYCPFTWLLGFFSNRDLSLMGSWRLAGAAMLPGALFLSGAIFLYGLGALDLVRLGLAGTLHLIIGWAYLAAGVFSQGRHPEARALKSNPFIEK